MNKLFGFRGSINPSSAFTDIIDSINYDNDITISIKNGVFEVGFDKEGNREEASKIANNYINSWMMRNGIKINVDFNQTWKPNINGNKDINIDLHEDLAVHDRVTTTTMSLGCGTFIVNKNDSYSFQNDTDIVKKSQKDETLSLALKYYAETLDHGQVMAGVHKAIEQITIHLDKINNNRLGREELAKMAGENRKYVDELMEGVQERRHSFAWLSRKPCKTLGEQESISRVKKLIEAYAKSITW